MTKQANKKPFNWFPVALGMGMVILAILVYRNTVYQPGEAIKTGTSYATTSLPAPADVTATGTIITSPDIGPKVTRENIIALLNLQRAAAGLPVLKEYATLDQAAELKAYDMATKHYLAHQNPGGALLAQNKLYSGVYYWLARAGYPAAAAGETIIQVDTTAQDAVRGWFSYAPDQATLMGNFEEIGVGVQGDIVEVIVGTRAKSIGK